SAGQNVGVGESEVTVDSEFTETDDNWKLGISGDEGWDDGTDVSVTDSNGQPVDYERDDDGISLAEVDNDQSYTVHFDNDGRRSSVIIGGQGEDAVESQVVDSQVESQQQEGTSNFLLTGLATGVDYTISDDASGKEHQFTSEDGNFELDLALLYGDEFDPEAQNKYVFTLTNLLGLHSANENGAYDVPFNYLPPEDDDGDGPGDGGGGDGDGPGDGGGGDGGGRGDGGDGDGGGPGDGGSGEEGDGADGGDGDDGERRGQGDGRVRGDAQSV